MPKQDAYSAAAEKARAFLEDESLVSEVEEWLERRREETENWVRNKSSLIVFFVIGHTVDEVG